MSDQTPPVDPANDPVDPPEPPEAQPADWAEQRRALRKEAAGFRVQAREAKEALEKFGPEGYQATLKAKDGEIRELKVGKALAESFHKHGAAKPTLVRAFLAEAGQLGQFDPSAEDFLEHVDTIVGETLAANPELRGSSAAPRSGLDPSAASGARPLLTREELAAMDPEAVIAARRRGDLDHLLGRG